MKGFRNKDREESSELESARGGLSSLFAMGNRRTRRIWTISVAGGLLLAGSVWFAGHQYVKANTTSYYRVYLDGQEIGTIQDKKQLNDLYVKKQAELTKQYPDVKLVLETEKVKAVVEKAYKAEINSASTLDSLEEKLKFHASGIALKVNGKLIGVVKDQEAADAVLKQVKNRYTPAGSKQNDPVKQVGWSKSVQNTSASTPKLESVNIKEKVEKTDINTKPEQILDSKEAVTRILQGGVTPIVYRVQEGDTITSIAKRFGISSKTLFHQNPGVEELTMQIGTPLNIKAVKPFLTVRTVELTSEQLVTEPSVIVRTNSKLGKGKTIVVSPGREGLKKMNYRLTKENGAVVQEQWLGQEVEKAPMPKIVVRGTLVLDEGSGDFAWPVSGGSMTSSYGERWGRMHKGVDLVSSNRNILAADSGVVSFAGQKNGYGNCIVINHKNGYETLYGHLSEISVKEGERVDKGTVIGIMGNTGHSFGTHLHFEIHKNGALDNPMKYL